MSLHEISINLEEFQKKERPTPSIPILLMLIDYHLARQLKHHIGLQKQGVQPAVSAIHLRTKRVLALLCIQPRQKSISYPKIEIIVYIDLITNNIRSNLIKQFDIFSPQNFDKQDFAQLHL